MIIDLAILALLVGPFALRLSSSKAMSAVIAVASWVLLHAYNIYWHGRFGATIGKKLMRIRVVRLDGKPVAWREAWLRESVWMTITFLDLASRLIALSTIAGDQFHAATWREQVAHLDALRPGWLAWSRTANGMWGLGKLFVALGNKQRRSPHDFFAGTVVISEKSASKIATLKGSRAEQGTAS